MTGWNILSVDCQGPCATPLPEMKRSSLLVFPATADGEALAGRTAVANHAVMLGRIALVRREGDHLLVTRTTHGGRLSMELSVQSGLTVATANSFSQAEGSIALGAPSTMPLDRVFLSGEGVALENAKTVVGGGRGLDETGFVQLERIAQALGGAVAASLPAVDLGLAPVSRQVGQSGKFVTPEVYLAAGMSGTPQHLAGIGAATRIIAINKDRDAAIFDFAEDGIVADARELLPLLVDALELKVKEKP